MNGPLPRRRGALLAVVALLASGVHAGTTDALGLFRDGRYIAAEDAARDALIEAEIHTGADSMEVARALGVLVEILAWRLESDPEALSLAERSLRIRERRLAPGDPGVADGFHGLGLALESASRPEDAAAAHRRALVIREVAFGRAHPATASSLYALAIARLTVGAWDEAQSLLDEALRIRVAMLGRDHPDVAMTRMALGSVAEYGGNHVAAEAEFREALRIRRAVLREGHPLVAGAMHNLAVVLQASGDLVEALQLYEQALAIREATLPAEDGRLATTHIAVASLQEDLGDFLAARRHYRRALESIREQAGEIDRYYAIALTSLARLDQRSGDLDAAQEQFVRALHIRRSLGDGDDLEVAKSLADLGFLELRIGNPSAAHDRFESCLRIRTARLPAGAPPLADAYRGRGSARAAQGDLVAARRDLEEAMRIVTTVYGEDAPECIAPASALARVALRSGNAAEARAALVRSRELVRRYYGADHPLQVDLWLDESEALERLGRVDEAFEAALQAARVARTHLVVTAAGLPERQALAYALQATAATDRVIRLLAVRRDPPASAVRAAWDAVLRQRGVVLDEMVTRRRLVAATTDPEILRLAADLDDTMQRLARVLVQGAVEHDAERFERVLRVLQARRERQEADLAAAGVSLRSGLARRDVGLADVEAAMPAGVALVAYVRYRDPAPMYGALIRTPDGGRVRFLALGAAEPIDEAVNEWKRTVSMRLASVRAAGRTLRRAVWDPLGPTLTDATRVFLVPDGSLNLVNVTALPDDDGGWLVERDVVVHLLSTERDAVRDPGRPTGRGMVAVGGPAFDAALEPVRAANRAAPAGSAAVRDLATGPYRGSHAACRSFGEVRFEPLPGTTAEVRSIAALRRKHADPDDPLDRVEVLIGPEAREGAVAEAVVGRETVHIATHGFFLHGRCAGIAADRRGIGGLLPGNASPNDAAPGGDSERVLSGLALAGANLRHRPEPSGEDGILTAEEIAGLDLGMAAWVVLSACDTGVGEVRAGEGVFGLRRAFRIAGARSLVMSLWAVDDDAAREWMEALYRGRLDRGLDTADAVRGAARMVLAARRDSGRDEHPFFWGGFVAAGDWH